MQITTTGYLMEVFCVVLIKISLLLLYLLYRRVGKLSSALHDAQKCLDYLRNDTDSIKERLGSFNHQLDEFSLVLKHPQATNKSIKPNNWDSMREAFKGPVRIEINERT
jgi:hypothetical protein